MLASSKLKMIWGLKIGNRPGVGMMCIRGYILFVVDKIVRFPIFFSLPAPTPTGFKFRTLPLFLPCRGRGYLNGFCESSLRSDGGWGRVVYWKKFGNRTILSTTNIASNTSVSKYSPLYAKPHNDMYGALSMYLGLRANKLTICLSSLLV